ncbi:MAG: DUF378 domain-containing protein [Hyphomicrobiaceae bacterium]
MRVANIIAQALLVIGGLNWGLVGLFQFDLVAALFGGEGAPLARLVYVLVGLAALYGLYLVKFVGEDRRLAGNI